MAYKCLVKEIGTNCTLFGLILMCTICKAELSPNEIKLRYTRHMMVFQQFPCELPQPRAIRVEELLANQIETSEIAQPHTTVLHRCDKSTGCCKERSKECKVAESEDIQLHFFVSDSIKRQASFKEFTVSNHTKCSCQSMKNDIK